MFKNYFILKHNSNKKYFNFLCIFKKYTQRSIYICYNFYFNFVFYFISGVKNMYLNLILI